MPNKTRFAMGSVVNQRMQASAVRAADAWQGVIRRCERIMEEIDEVTQPGTPRVEIHDEDSMVIAVGAASLEHKKIADGQPAVLTPPVVG